MAPMLLEGKKVSDAIKEEVKHEAEDLLRSKGPRPGLGVILVGDDPASRVYVKTKARACQEVGFFSDEILLSEKTSQDILLGHIRKLNERQDIHGILVQQPLPSHIRESVINEAILPEKDVDGFHPFNMGRLLLGDPLFVPCTPLGIWEMLRWYHIDPSGKHVVVVGRSNIVGKPAAALFVQKSTGANATVTILHSGTKDLKGETLRADILIVAIGRPEFLKADMVREGVVVVDVGINRIQDAKSEKGYRLAGDVDFKEVAPKARAITPVPGGIGMMTVAMLLKNTLKAAKMTVEKEACCG